MVERDLSLDSLLRLDGETLVIDAEGRHWVKFVVRRVAVSIERPHGLDYSLTLHGSDGERLVGYDNAHPVGATSGPGRRRSVRQDHRHRLKTVRPYQYEDAATLLSDFWSDVEAVLRARGVWK